MAIAADARWLLPAGLAVTALGVGALLLHLIAEERRRHLGIQETLGAQATFLESLVDSLREIAAALDPEQALEVTRQEAERLFDARASLLGEDGEAPERPEALVVPLRVRDELVASLVLERDRPFERPDATRAALLGEFGCRAIESARLIEEATVREAERAALSERLITAEQDERRRLALFLHDTSVQSLSGIALMLDATMHAIEDGRLDEAVRVLRAALDRHRSTIGALRELSFALEPVVLRDQGFRPAVAALAQEVGLEHKVQVEVDVAAAETLGEADQVALYQIVREAVDGAVRRGPPTRASVRVAELRDGRLEVTIEDDAPLERRRSTLETLADRARTLSGKMEVEHGEDSGTTVRLTLPRSPHG